MIGTVILIGVPVLLGVTFWYGLRGRPNEGPELGHNSPYPTWLMPPVGAWPDIVEEDDGAGPESARPKV